MRAFETRLVEAKVWTAQEHSGPSEKVRKGAREMILFLDFDGVLHPDAVYLEKRGPVLRAPGELFMWAGLLEDALAPHPDLKIVLSTSWVRFRSFSRTRKALPSRLQSRVIGATWHSRTDPVEWRELSRYQQIRRYLSRTSPTEWLALDDDDEAWGENDRYRLILTDPSQGIGKQDTLTDFREKLASCK
ncbi:HAD domain-containing protein [Paludibacterium sp. B53371]|uniref:HAD domain-containing protein n=1 Tax=Paludibacterium sp. B53371 TaxID=2806263 RepID=UPI001C0477E6|nr:HAD domain-containing protein [Paludibacterium sp. B53371]